MHGRALVKLALGVFDRHEHEREAQRGQDARRALEDEPEAHKEAAVPGVGVAVELDLTVQNCAPWSWVSIVFAIQSVRYRVCDTVFAIQS